MENSFDNAHFSFVHRNTFGKFDAPVPSRMNLHPFENGLGFTMDMVVPVKNVPLSMKASTWSPPRPSGTTRAPGGCRFFGS